MYKWVYLVFPFVYSVSVYHGYNNANIGPYRVGTLPRPLVRAQSNKGWLEAVRPPASAGPPSSGQAAS